MYNKAIKYSAITLILVALYTLLMQQAIEQGRFYHAQQDYSIEAALLAYNPLLKATPQNAQELANQQLFTTLNFIQFYDFLAKANAIEANNSLGKLLGNINDRLDTTPHAQQLQRTQAQQKIACHLLARKQQQLIPNLNEIMPTYLSLHNPLKLLLDEKQINAAWLNLHCN